MIVRDKPGALQLLFAVRGSVLPHIAGELAVVTAIAAAMVWVDRHVVPLPHLSATPFAVFGIALSLFLGFRNNAAYDRWWEARKLWGGLLADLRTYARTLDIFLPDPAARKDQVRLALAFLHLHRLNLRRQPVDESAARILTTLPPGLAAAPHPPCAALEAMTAELAAARARGDLDGFGARALAARLDSMAFQQAGCERIAGTPLPYVYSLLIYRTSYLYCFLVPFALLETAGWLTPLFAGIVAYVFFGLAEVTEELAHPFGITQNGLALEAICRTAEISLAPHLGEPVPAPLQPANFRLD